MDKLKGIPKIYYFNLDERPDRKEYTENQYSKYGIINYERYSMSKYQHHNFDEWKDKLILNDISLSDRPKLHIIECSMTLSYLEFLKNWLEDTDEDQILIMEDDYDLSYIDYWHFDWEYLMDHIPFDWDCVQLSFENNDKIPCFLHPILPGHSLGSSILNRNYVEKIIRVVMNGGKFDLTKRVGNFTKTQKGTHRLLDKNKWRHPNISMDYIMSHVGKTYCLPLFTQSTTIGSYPHDVVRVDDFPSLHFTDRAVRLWWTKLRDKFTLEDFFMYGKPNDFILTPKIVESLETKFDNIEFSKNSIEKNKKIYKRLRYNP